MTGIVTKSTGSWYIVRTGDKKYHQCRIRGKFRLQGIKSTNPISVGDVVDFDLEENEETGVIDKIHDRKNYIVRKSVNLSKQTHIIAANIDTAFLLVTVDNPPTLPGFIDRFLATAEAYNISAVLLFNKIDSHDETQEEKREELIEIYTKIGYQCIEISAVEKVNLDAVKSFMQDKTTMFSGHSGVGKSTLINAIEPTLDIKTAEISAQHKQGQHTTTFAEMHELSFGGFIIDTPGIKGFGVVDFEPQEITDYFPELFALKKDCKFNNCLHQKEPKCAVKLALEDDRIAPSRYFSYLQMLKEDEEHFRQSQFMH
ncbi:MAG: ribosome biogenesis GTPase [Urechidicola sp.]|jgi:ribosome biogenesis GTPase|tara:strand:- start:184 stop:1125 length:942 start_codon:yes stop_codon:yes gene_type:complete